MKTKYYSEQKQLYTYSEFLFDLHKSSKLALLFLHRTLMSYAKALEILFAKTKLYFRSSNSPATSKLECLQNLWSLKKKSNMQNILPGVGTGSSILLQWSLSQQWGKVITPSLEDGAQTNGLSRGIRSISAIHMLLCMTLSAVRVTEVKQSPSVTHVKLSFVHRWQ